MFGTNDRNYKILNESLADKRFDNFNRKLSTNNSRRKYSKSWCAMKLISIKGSNTKRLLKTEFISYGIGFPFKFKF